MTLTTDDRPTAADWFTSARKDVARPITFTSGLTVGTVAEWSAAVVRHDFDETTLFAPGLAVDGNTVTITLTAADLAALLVSGASKWTGRWRILHATTGVEFAGRLVVDRWGTQTGTESGAITAVVDGTTVTATVLGPYNPDLFVALSAVAGGPEGRALVADPAGTGGIRVRYPAPKGNRLGVIGTSIELGSGGDQSMIGSFVDGRPSNADYLLWAAGGSAGRWRYERNAGVGGNPLGGIFYLLADAPAGSTTLDVGFSYTDGDGNTVEGLGVVLPQQTETLFFDWGFTQGSTGDATEACYVNAVPVVITGGERVTLQSATAEDHFAGDVIRSGMIGRFAYDVAYYPIDVLVIGGPTNNVGMAGWDADSIAAGQQILCEQALDADMVPVVTTICARSTSQDETDAANKAIRANAETHGHALADFWRATVNPVNRQMRTEITADTIHPNQQGAQELAQCLVDEALDPMDVRRDARHNGSSDAYSFNMVTNGTFSGGTTGSAGTLTPVGWSVLEFFSSNILNSVVAPKLLDDIPGQLCRITASGGKGTHGIKLALSLTASGNYPGLSAGDSFMMQSFVKLRGFKPDGFCLASVGLVLGGSLGAVTQYLFYQWGRDAEPGYLTSEVLTVPAATVGTLTSATVQIQLVCPALASSDSGYGILEVGDFTLLNLTKGGL